MILVDYREGSKELLEPLRKRGLNAVIDDLPTDLVFIGRGVKGAPLSVGIEHKKVQDLMQSLRTNRLNEQADKMVENDFDVKLLFIQGPQRFDQKGRMLRRVGRKEWRPIPGIGHGEIIKRLYSLQFCRGLVWQWFESETTCVKAIELLYRSLTDKDLDKHDSFLQPYQAMSIVPMSKRRKTFCTFPGVQRKVSQAVQDHFGTIRRAVAAGPKEWAALTTKDDQGHERRFGDAAAKRIQDFFDSKTD